MIPRTTPPDTAASAVRAPHPPAPVSPGPSTAAGSRTMSSQSAEQWTLVTAGIVIVALTGAAFWLSYAHLAEVAGQHGLGHSPARQWAWPATLDAAIVAGELLMLRAGLRKEVDWWAIALTAAGSVGSIALNIAGVSSTGRGGSVPVLDYVVAAVPPTAALVSFGVLMRQIHRLVAHPGNPIETPAVAPAPAAIPAMATDTHGAPEQRTKPATGPNPSTGPDDWPGSADQTSSSATDQPNTGTDHHPAPVPERTNPADRADHHPAPGPVRTDTADQPLADQNQKAAAQADHLPKRPRTSPADPTTTADQTAADQEMARDHARTKPADQPLTNQDQRAADQADHGPDRVRITPADQARPADQLAADHRESSARTSISAGHAADQAADHQRTIRQASSGPAADQPVRAPWSGERTADHVADRTSETPADHPADPVRTNTADRDRTTADRPRTKAADQPPDQRADQGRTSRADQSGPVRDSTRTTGTDQTSVVREHVRTTGGDHDGLEEVVVVPMERLVELARTAALAEGRMTRRVIRPYLRAQSIQISNERFTELQSRLHQDPALAHLPRSQRTTRQP